MGARGVKHPQSDLDCEMAHASVVRATKGIA